MALSHSPKIVTDGLVLCLDAGDGKSYSGSGTTWTDRSGNGNHGTLTNGPTYSSENGGVLVFDGIDDHIAISPDFSSVNEFSVSFWAKNNVYGTETTQALAGNYPQGGTYIRINTMSTYFSILVYVNGIENNYFKTVNINYTLINKDDWNNYVVTFKNNDALKIYVNSNLVDSQSLNSSITGLNTFYKAIGRYAISYLWDGQIGSTFIHNKALTAAEILQNYNAQKGRFS